MALSPREILRRIRGIKSTQQITRAMQMVAAVKLEPDQVAGGKFPPVCAAPGDPDARVPLFRLCGGSPVFNPAEGNRRAAPGDYLGPGAVRDI